MKKLKRKHRLEIYKSLLECYVDEIHDDTVYFRQGMCYNLTRLLKSHICKYVDASYIMQFFPEIESHRPTLFYTHNLADNLEGYSKEFIETTECGFYSFWWYQNSDRIDVLRSIIYKMETAPWHKKLFQ